MISGSSYCSLLETEVKGGVKVERWRRNWKRKNPSYKKPKITKNGTIFKLSQNKKRNDMN